MLIDLQVSDSSCPEKPRRRKIINTRFIAEIDPVTEKQGEGENAADITVGSLIVMQSGKKYRVDDRPDALVTRFGRSA